MSDVLNGMRVVEVSAFVAAPSGGMTLAQMGAEVIRIDPPRGGLDYRRWPVLEGDSGRDNVSLFWAGLNKHKKSVAIDFTRPEGKELAQRLITAPGEDAGLLLTNMPPRGWLDYDRLKQHRSDLIQLTVQGDRHGGSAVDYTLNPRVGLPYLTGPGDYQGVVNHVLPAWDLVTGQMAALGLLAAERLRSKTRNAAGIGQGQHVKLPLEDVALAIMSNLGFIAEAERGVERPRFGNDLFGAFGRDFVSADKQRVMVVGLTLKQWQNLVASCGLESDMEQLALRLGRNFKLEGDRFKSRDEIAGYFARVIETKPYAEVAALFDRHGVCWGKYQTVQELVASDAACSTANPMFSKVEQPRIGPTLTPASPLNFGSGRRPAERAPLLGEHTETVLLDTLKLSSGELGALLERGIVALGQGQRD
ncbi:2-methylfumaryl-CoA isomerase [Pseudomaricurvus alcaniphilus]|uniref:CoA transferase n=1 Tax=Pseudomaricurvus alcaniphilus TaxID=1166482 RepID=UPI0014098C4F|nr:CoA transferase [Pseudomaricurvus alcaniphilus]NHN39003.1 2-methylfumaryl-CoA isomerase [Pseudomaricurvus alcaniphilus]